MPSSQPRDRTHVSCLLHWQVGSLPRVPPGKPEGAQAMPFRPWPHGLQHGLLSTMSCCSPYDGLQLSSVASVTSCPRPLARSALSCSCLVLIWLRTDLHGRLLCFLNDPIFPIPHPHQTTHHHHPPRPCSPVFSTAHHSRASSKATFSVKPARHDTVSRPYFHSILLPHFAALLPLFLES